MKELLGLAELLFYPFYIFPALIGWVLKTYVLGNLGVNAGTDDLKDIVNPMDGLLG